MATDLKGDRCCPDHLQDRDSGTNGDLVLLTLSGTGKTPRCAPARNRRTLLGVSAAKGVHHTTEAMSAETLHGCESRYARRKKVDAAVQQALSAGDTAPTPTASTTTSKAGPPSSPWGVIPLAKDAGPQRPCERCLRGERSHARHNPLADNCLLFGVENPTPATARRLFLEHEIALAKHEARTKTAASSLARTSPAPN